MKHLTIMLGLFILSACQSTPNPSNTWTQLLDMNLSKWESYISYAHTTQNIQGPPTNADGIALTPLGLNNDPHNVFTMNLDDGEPVLRVSGEYYGGLGSLEAYENYHLKLMVKWGDQKWIPRLEDPRDTGILYHGIGDYGVDYWLTWWLSQEMQIIEGGMGDYWSIAGSQMDIRADKNPDGTFTYNAKAPLTRDRGDGGFSARLAGDFENPNGQWNTLELISFGDKSIHIVNDHVVMALENSHYVLDGEKMPLTKGKLLIQSEAAEAYFKNIQIRSLDKMPDAYAVYFETEVTTP